MLKYEGKLLFLITMKQKIKWMLFLIFGISIIANFSACRKDHALTVEWVYINETDSSISFFPPRINFNLNPNSSYSEIETTEADQNVEINDVGVPLNVDVIFYNNNLCDTFEPVAKGGERCEFDSQWEWGFGC